MSSGIGYGNRRSRPYRKRRPLPALIVIGVLGLIAMFIWVRAITSKQDIDAALRCDPPPTPPPGVTYTNLGYTALDGTTPVPADRIAVKVLNASEKRGQAAITTESLRQLGFTQIAPPENDPAYATAEAACRGQLRFGDNGSSAARTLSLVVPCVELVRDNREDASVDLAIGSAFGDVVPTQAAREILAQLQAWSAQHDGDGGEQSAVSPPPIDEALLAAARPGTC
ncbi:MULTISPECIES: envelope integrity protein Cei [Amycolatopsis]|uniref:Envelope integrity protein Cei n=1 Tax=Amycolatopsis thermalba TaxID=944492 RepID=A0ABY4P1B2_9PSEU|nr:MULTISPECIES: envelope integrity protein Cei [Amycolatopsis]UQS26137.1 envelope integrity protein Cei [Amycolatopsis thermalba]